MHVVTVHLMCVCLICWPIWLRFAHARGCVGAKTCHAQVQVQMSTWYHPRKHAIAYRCSVVSFLEVQRVHNSSLLCKLPEINCSRSQSSWLVLSLGGLPRWREGGREGRDWLQCVGAQHRRYWFQEEGISEKLMSQRRLLPLYEGPCFGQAAKLDYGREGTFFLPAHLQAHHQEPGQTENTQQGVPAPKHKLYTEQ